VLIHNAIISCQHEVPRALVLPGHGTISRRTKILMAAHGAGSKASALLVIGPLTT
jgi:hypothetical protein